MGREFSQEGASSALKSKGPSGKARHSALMRVLESDREAFHHEHSQLAVYLVTFRVHPVWSWVD